jgi:hypothetical protein
MRPRSLLFAVFLLSLCASAQTGRFQVFGGYSYLGYYTYAAYFGPWSVQGYNGVETSVSYRFFPHIEAEADAGFYFQSPSIQTYMGGPRVSAGSRRFRLFGHALFGGLRESYSSLSGANTTFAYAFGGGADALLAGPVGLRVIQADYLRTSTNVGSYFAAPGNHGNFRISTGVVFRF